LPAQAACVHDRYMNTRPLKSLVRIGRGSKRERRYKTVRHQLAYNPSVPGILEFLGVQMADRSTQESAVQRAVQIGWLLAPERDLMRTAGWPGI
jgi:hypothetical protein